MIKVTGSGGFVGSLVSKILGIPSVCQYDTLDGEDILNQKVVDNIVFNARTVIHLAALSGLQSCEESPSLADETNHKSTISLAKQAKSSGVKNFILASTSAVYGEACDYRMDESHPTNPRSVYGKTKLAAEKILGLSDESFKVVILRKSNVYGYGTQIKGNTVIDIFLDKYFKHKSITIKGTGEQRRDFVHVFDISNLYANIALSNRVRSGIYNVGGLDCLSVRSVAETINEIGYKVFGYRVPINFEPGDKGMTSHNFIYDWTKAKMEFMYFPLLSFEYYIKERMLMKIREPRV